MITLSRFITTENQSELVQMYKPCVPSFWKGYYAIFKPKKDGLWTKKWFANNKSKTFKKAYRTIKVENAHKKWNDFLKKTL